MFNEKDLKVASVVFDEKDLRVTSIDTKLAEYATENFKEIFESKPDETGSVQILKDGKYVWHPIYRYFKSYLVQVPFKKNTGKAYMFGGDEPTEEYIPLPEALSRFQLDGFNQCTVNWYRKDIDYIEPHGDCTNSWVGDYVYIINLMEDPKVVMLFDIYNKDKSQLLVSVEMKHGSVIRMSKDFQVEYRHGVWKPPCNRVSLTFRCVESNL